MEGRRILHCCTTKCCENATQDVKIGSDIAKRMVERVTGDKRRSLNVQEVERLKAKYEWSLKECEAEEAKHAKCREEREVK